MDISLSSPILTDLGWCAGLYEGDGTIKAKRSSSRGFIRYYPCVILHMSDKDVLERWRDEMGFGKLYGPYSNGALGKKPMYKLVVHQLEEVTLTVELLWPYLGERRRAQALSVLSDVQTCNQLHSATG